MILRFFFVFLVLVLAYLGDETVTKNKQNRIYIRVALVFFLSIFVVFVSDSADRLSYFYFYDVELPYYRLENLWEWLSFSNTDTEPGFVLLANVARMIGLSSSIFLLLVTLVANTLVVNVLYRFRYPLIVFLLFMISASFRQEANLVRQSLAAMICIYATRYIIEKDWKKHLLFVFIAFTIHKTASLSILFTPLIFLGEKQYKYVKIALAVLWLLSLGFVTGRFSSFDFLFSYFGNYVEETRYGYYALEDASIGASKVEFDYMYNFFVLFCLLFERRQKNMIYSVYYILGCIAYNMAFGAEYMTRIALYFMPMFAAYTPTLLVEQNSFKMDKDKQTSLMILAFLFLFYIRKVMYL